jgi:GntR family transcriptional regulator, transcriptional repressor for pyruvate dehydrogenase complex
MAPSGGGSGQDRAVLVFTFKPVEARGTVRQVVERIAEPIRLGRLRFGDRLPAERALAQQLGVSRETVRKAVRALVDAGVLEVTSGRGSRSGIHVRSDLIPPELLRGPTSLPIGEISGVLEARRLFEPRVAQLAGLLATEDDFAELQGVIDLQHELTAEPQRVRDLDAPFHLALARATHNATVVALMHTLFERLEVAKRFAIEPGEAERAIDIHERTLAALMSRNLDSIERVMDAHLSILERAWERESGRALPRKVPEFLLPAD